MKKFVEKTQPVYVTQELVSRTCDLCGRESNEVRWEGKGIYDVEESEITIEVRLKEGESYPEDAFGTKYEIDLCPACFKERLVPWLKSQGADIHEEKWGW